MRILLLSDTHFDDKPNNEYRWELFPWIIEVCTKHNIKHLIINGDIFQEKDKYSSRLVNRFVDNLKLLLNDLDQIFLLKGNHDEIEYANPYLRWLNNIPRVRFFIKPEMVLVGNKRMLFIPASKTFEEDCRKLDLTVDYIFVHQTFTGSISEGGQKLSGISQSMFDNTKAKIYCGDIHRPDKLGRIVYIGSPYHISFGDHFLPRCIILDIDTGKESNIHFKTVRRFTVNISHPNDLENLPLIKGDQIKVRLTLDNIIDWEEHRSQISEYCISNGITLNQIECLKQDTYSLLEEGKEKLQSLSKEDIFNKFCKFSKINEEVITYGKQIIKGG